MGNIGTGAQPVTKTTNAILVLPEDHHIIQKKLKKNSIDMKTCSSMLLPVYNVYRLMSKTSV